MWNDKETDLDLLGNGRIAETITSIMSEQELHPLTIGVYGSWGVGKSSVLKLIEGQLKQDKSTLCIEFNGWLFQGYEDTRSALMETVIAKIVHLQPLDQKTLRLGKSLFKRINWLKVAKTAGSIALTAVSGLPSPALWGLPNIIKETKHFFNPNEEKDEKKPDDKDSFLKEEEETVPGQIHAFRKELEELIENSKVSKIIVLVDELDRCLPSAVIDILEAIRLFLFVKGTVFVLAADEQMIEYSVRKHYPDLPVAQEDYIKHYLEKLVQIPFRIPSLNQLQAKNYVRLLLIQHQLKNDKIKVKELYKAFEETKETPYDNKDLSYDFIKNHFQLNSNESMIKDSMLVAEQLGAILAKELRENPRTIKRFLNTIFLRLRIAEIYKIGSKVRLDVLAKLMLLERFHSNIYELIILQAADSLKGIPEVIGKLEDSNEQIFKDAFSKLTVKTTNENELIQIKEWAKLKPVLKDIDFRPYIFISSEKSIFTQSSDELPAYLKPIFDVLIVGVAMTIASKEQDIKALTDSQTEILFNELSLASQKSSDWSKTTGPINGIINLTRLKPSIEEKFIMLLDIIPKKDLKPWAVSNLNGFTSESGKLARNNFFKKIIASSDTSQSIKNLANQFLNK